MTDQYAIDPLHRDSPAHVVVRERCRTLGLPVWRCDASGQIVDEPMNEGLAGLWLRSGEVARLVAETVRAGGERSDAPVEVFPGCRVLLIEESYRRRRTGWTVAMALESGALEAEVFVAACASANLDPHTTRVTMSSLATVDGIEAARLLRMLRWMADDVSQIREHETTIGGFTDQLTDAYETIDLLYTLGHSMIEPTLPEHFVQLVLERLCETLEFGWVGAVFVEDERMAPVVAGRFMLAGGSVGGVEATEHAARALVGRCDSLRACKILSNVPGFEPHGGPQIVIQPIMRQERVIGHLLVGDKRGNDPQVSSYDTHLLEAAAGYLAPFMENASLYADQQAMFMGTLHSLTAAIDAKDRYTCGHSERVAHMAAKLAEAVGLDRSQVERVHIAGLVHDVGKIGVPEAILSKAGRLTDEEFNVIRRHPEIGHTILRDIPLMHDVLPGVLHHHERWDGRGYPHGLAGEEIPFIGRLLGLADTFDAMSSTRSYRPALDRTHVLEEIRKCAGTQFDPELAEAFLTLDLSEYDWMVERAATVESALPQDSHGRAA